MTARTITCLLLLVALAVQCHAQPDARIWALEQIESGADPEAIGDDGLAVGILQITPIMVAEVNRILGHQRYTLEDRKCVNCSRAMAAIALRDARTAQEVARVWNPGADADYVERLGNLIRWRERELNRERRVQSWRPGGKLKQGDR